MINKVYEYQKLVVQNRIVRAATNDYCGEEDGSISAKQIDIYRQLAQSGIGMIITGNFCIAEDGRLDSNQNTIGERFDYDGATLLCDTVHAYGSKIIFQISHAGRKTKVSELLAKHFDLAQEIRDEEIDSIIMGFAEASRRAKESAADGVQIHFGHGYLLSELLTERKDGVDIASKLFKAVREVVGMFPVLVKVNTDIPYYIKKNFYKCCEKYEIWAIELSGSSFAQKTREEHLYYANDIQICKDSCNVPVILTGGLRNKEDIEQALSKGANLVGMSRPFICQPTLLKKLETEGSRCVSCNRCFHIYKERKQHCAMRSE
jgi:2,4-dienoyl-CoA reductase-like NADH-dependent reductase (Old Yellow Enzyme family)